MPKVAHVVLEPVTAEPFLLRAEKSAVVQFANCLADLETVAGLEPHDAALEPGMDPAARAAAVDTWSTAIKRSTMRP